MQARQQEFDSIFVGILRVTPALSTAGDPNSCLSAHDRERADRFRFPEDRLRFVLGRRLLAVMIREHHGSWPEPLNLTLTEYGRPYLADYPTLAFSISHAGDVVAVALGMGARVGIDVESLDRRLNLDALAERIFHAADLVHFRTLPEEDKHRAFFHAWTGKEAILKAKGVGLFGGVQKISVPLNEQPKATIFDTVSKSAWQLTSLDVPEGYLGAVACDDPGKTIRVRDYLL